MEHTAEETEHIHSAANDMPAAVAVNWPSQEALRRSGDEVPGGAIAVKMASRQ